MTTYLSRRTAHASAFRHFPEVGPTSAFARRADLHGPLLYITPETGRTKPGLVWRTVLDFPAIRIRLTFPMELKHE